MTTSPKKVRWQSIIHLLVMVLMVGFVFCRFIPSYSVRSAIRYDDGENSWTEALHMAYLGHLQFGTDIIFTYGPWGFLARGYHPETYLTAVISWLALSTIFLLAGWRLARQLSGRWYVAALWLAAFAAAASLCTGNDFDTRLIAWNVLLLYLCFFSDTQKGDLVQITLAFSLGWLSLVKFTGMMESTAVISVIALDKVVRQRRFPWVAPGWLAGILIFWLAAGQHLNSLAPFLRNSWEISQGYTEGMMLSSSGNVVERAFCFWLVAILLGALTLRIGWPQRRFFALLPVAALGALMIITFKGGYVRADWKHEPSAGVTLVLISMVCLAAANLGDQKMIRKAALTSALTAAFAVLVLAASFSGEWWAVTRSFGISNLMATISTPFSGQLKDEYAQRLKRNRDKLSLPPFIGNMDLYSYHQSLLFGTLSPYEPRPIIQSYSAYTAKLARMNAAHLRTARAAGNIMFAVETIDGRFPSLDDGCSWLELLTLYDIKRIADPGGSFLLLSRATEPRQFQLTPVRTVSAGFGEPVAVPATTNGAIWVEMDIPKTFAGKLVSAFYKPDTLSLSVTLHDHTHVTFRLIPDMAASGFLLSPIVDNARAFAALATGEFLKSGGIADVESISISADTKSGSTIDYQSPMSVRFYRLSFPYQNFSWPLSIPH